MSEEEHGRRAEQFKEVFDVFSDQIPRLLDSLTDAVYGKAASAKVSAAMAGFFSTLKKSGMTDAQAFTLTEQYMSSLNLGNVIANAISNRRTGDA